MITPKDMAKSLKRSKRELTDRFIETSDETEKRKLQSQLEDLERKIDKVVFMGLHEAAAQVADAADGLLDVVRSAKTGAIDGYIQRIGTVIANLRLQIEDAINQVTGEKRDFPKTEDTKKDRPLITLLPETPPLKDSVQIPSIITMVIKSTKFNDLKSEYEADWDSCQIRKDKKNSIINFYLNKMNANKEKYEQIAGQFPGMPWHFIGVINAMETGFRFDRHLHNGDPLSDRTVRVPKGHPISGSPPFSWEMSAKDAIEQMGFDNETDWSIPYILYRLEKFNGFGYRFKELRTPYLWSFSNLYNKGRYVADGVFDPNAVSEQCGAATMLKALNVF